MSNETQIAVLNNLIKTTLDSVKGFQDAAKEANAGRFAPLFTQMAAEREQVAHDLQEAVRRLGGTAEDSSSMLGAAHRTVLNLKQMLYSFEEKAIIEEVERGEDYIKSKFELALADGNVPVETRGIIERSFASVRKGHDSVSALKHSLV